MKHTFAVLSLLLMIASSASAGQYDVGGGNNDYATMSALLADMNLAAGDIVNIYPGTYTDTWNLSNAMGTEEQPITIRGVDDIGNPIISPQETVVFDYAANNTKQTPIKLYGSWIVIQGLAFKNSTRSGDLSIYGDIFRVWTDGTTVIRYNLFKDNTSTVGAKENYVTLIIEYNEFSGGSTTNSNPHMLYSIAGKHLIVRHNYFHGYNSSLGSIIKTRDLKADILYNYIEMGTAKGAIDACEYEFGSASNQHTNVVGNIFIKSIDDNTWAQSFVKHSYDDQATARSGKATIINNTFVDLTGTIEGALNLTTTSGSDNEISNNIFYGVDDLTSSLSDDTLVGQNNFIPSGVNSDGLSNSIEGDDPGFVGGGDYHLSSTSPLFDAGYGSASVQPSYHYVAPAKREDRTIFGAQIDIGAYEYIIITPPQNLRVK